MNLNVLLVEGKDDLHVCKALFQANETPETFQIEEAGGVEPLLESIPVRLKGSELERLGVVLDADTDLDARWDQLRAIIKTSTGLVPPKQPDPGGTVITLPGEIEFGAWLMPNNQIPGILEDFLAFLVPQGDVLLPRVDRFLESIPAGERRFSESRDAKARLHAWLAIQEHPGRPLGLAITSRYFSGDSEAAAPFLTWITRLFPG